MGCNTLSQYAHIALPPTVTLLPLFLYGTLRDPDILATVLGRTVSDRNLVAATAPDCAAVYFPDRFYPALVQRTGSAAPGLLLTGATTDDLAALDAFEGDEYWRGPITVTTADGALLADAYLPTLAIPADAAPWTLEDWTRDHKAQMLAGELATAEQLRQRLLGRFTT
jgi:gamma-glutamylcyclotransferase (GGCT)/AIG2-like uncharacterized protein YtfP